MRAEERGGVRGMVAGSTALAAGKLHGWADAHCAHSIEHYFMAFAYAAGDTIPQHRHRAEHLASRHLPLRAVLASMSALSTHACLLRHLPHNFYYGALCHNIAPNSHSLA